MADYSGAYGPEREDRGWSHQDYMRRQKEQEQEQQAAYDTYKDNIEASLNQDKDEIQRRFDEKENENSAGAEPELYQYSVTYRVLALNPLHAVTLVPQAQNIEVKLVPYVHSH